MKVKIKKANKVKQFKLINKWSDVTMETWLKLIDFKQGTKTKQVKETILALSDIPIDLINKLEIKDVSLIMEYLSELQASPKNNLNNIIKIEQVEYGFHPDLNSITLGEWSDIESFIKNGLEQNLPEIMAILYRPVIEKENNIYTIQSYDGDITIRAEHMKKMSAEQVQSALVFFWNLGKELLRILELYLTSRLMETSKQYLQSPLRKSGDILD